MSRVRLAAIDAWSPPLVRAAWLNIALLIGTLVGLLIDPRVIAGAPAWLKPAKFCISVAVYLLTIAWMVRDLPRTRMLRVVTTAIAWIISAEVLLIMLQAARGTLSHFNVDTAFDAAIFSSMGVGIATVWVCTMVILWIHWRTPARDRTMALACRLGLLLQIAGAGIGWTMTRPFPGQTEALQHGVRPLVIGAHTVGARDGGPGLPITRWSTEHGDLRIAHFVGMHALQILPLLLLAFRSVRGSAHEMFERVLLLSTSAAYAAFVVMLLVQALHGHPFLSLFRSQ